MMTDETLGLKEVVTGTIAQAYYAALAWAAARVVRYLLRKNPEAFPQTTDLLKKARWEGYRAGYDNGWQAGWHQSYGQVPNQEWARRMEEDFIDWRSDFNG